MWFMVHGQPVHSEPRNSATSAPTHLESWWPHQVKLGPGQQQAFGAPALVHKQSRCHAHQLRLLRRDCTRPLAAQAPRCPRGKSQRSEAGWALAAGRGGCWRGRPPGGQDGALACTSLQPVVPGWRPCCAALTPAAPPAHWCKRACVRVCRCIQCHVCLVLSHLVIFLETEIHEDVDQFSSLLALPVSPG